MKSPFILALFFGASLAILLIAAQGAGHVVSLLSGAGWILLWVVPLQCAPLLLDVAGWQRLLRQRAGLLPLFVIAAIRQAVNRLLPVANVGGEIVGIRLLVHHGVSGGAATASVVVEVLCTLAAQLLFVVMGMCWLFSRTAQARLTLGALLGLSLVAAVIVLLAGSLRNGSVFARIESAAMRLVRRRPAGAAQGAKVDAFIEQTLADKPGLLQAVGWQLASLIAGVAESWLALRWLGHPVSFGSALALESTAQAARSIFFIVPAGLGVQEAGLVGAGHLLGVGAELALALSLVKRMREIAFGVPALLAWQWMEGRRLVLGRKSRREGGT